MNTITRREFLGKVLPASGAGLAAAAGGFGLPARAIEPIRRKGRCRLRLSMAAYSFRDYFRAGANPHIDLHDFIDYCADHGCEGTELTSYYFPPDPTREYLIGLKRHAFLRGLTVSGTAVGNNFALPEGPAFRAQVQMVKDWIDRAVVLGAPHIRVFAGSPKGIDEKEAIRRCVLALEECGEYASRRGVWLGLENHGGLVGNVRRLLEIVRAVKSRWVGVNLDTGNFYQTDDPYRDMALLAPYAVNVQFKVRINWPGKGRVPSDPDRVASILREVSYQGFVALEYEEKAPWKEIPGWLEKLSRAFAKA